MGMFDNIGAAVSGAVGNVAQAAGGVAQHAPQMHPLAQQMGPMNMAGQPNVTQHPQHGQRGAPSTAGSWLNWLQQIIPGGSEHMNVEGPAHPATQQDKGWQQQWSQYQDQHPQFDPRYSGPTPQLGQNRAPYYYSPGDNPDWYVQRR